MLELSHIRAGKWEGVIVAPEEPQIELLHHEAPLPGLTLSRGEEGRWHASVALPAEILSDGVVTLLIHDRKTQETLGRVLIMAGEPLAEDLRAEIELLRAELDLLKKAFRRHCAETGA